MNQEIKKAEQVSSLSFARLPIFDAKRHLWGYELSYVQGKDAVIADNAENLASGTYMALQQVLEKKRKIMMNFSMKEIYNKLPYALPPNRAAIQLLELSNLEKAYFDSVQQLKEDEYQIVVEWSRDYKKYKSFFDIADIINIDVSKLDGIKIVEVINEIELNDAQLLASNVDTRKRFEICLNADFSIYQGS
ncbi:MAG: hypothetical protein KAR45_02855, partial [Desulfobacteraceae bacterium]|nr:hypothetical protein [Desulfobacteraceae bacterium]